MAIYQITALMSWRDQACRNVFHYETTDVLDSSQLTEAADAVRAAYASLDSGSKLVNDWILQGVTIRRVDLPDLPGIDVSFTSGSLSGTVINAGTINQAALIVSGQALTTKPRRVRTYLCGWEQDAITDGGFWDSAALSNAASWRAAMDELAVTGDNLARVAVEYTGTPPRVTASNRIEVYSTRANPGTQRRRRIGVGA